MSLLVTTDIQCDFPNGCLLVTTDIQCDFPNGCLQWVHGTTGLGVRGAEARAEAGLCGWTSERTAAGWVDLCPEHSATPDELALLESVRTEAGQ